MPIYDVWIYYSGKVKYEVEAKDEDDALDKAHDELMDDTSLAPDVEDSEVSLSDCQYTDLEELQDEEERYSKKEEN